MQTVTDAVLRYVADRVAPDQRSLRRRCGDWFATQETGSLWISDWVLTEVASALSLKVRTKALQVADREAIARPWGHLQASLGILHVERDDFVAAARFVSRHELGLRGADGLHFAVAARAGQAIATLDRRMSDAAKALDIPIASIDCT